MDDLSSLKKQVLNRLDMGSIELIFKLQLIKDNTYRCPLCHEPNCVLTYNDFTKRVYCNKCDFHGDPVTLYSAMENVDEQTALRTLAILCEVKLPAKEDNNEVEAIKKIRNATTDFYRKSINEKAIEYLHKRGFKDETIDHFQIGFSNGRLREHLISLGFSDKLAMKAGVLILNKDGNIREWFFNRAVISNVIKDNTVFMTGRAIDNSPKRYLNQTGKIEYLFNEEVINESDDIVLCEGPFDAIAVYQLGYKSISIFGVHSFPPEIIKSKLEKVAKVYICFDPDDEGKKAALKIATALGEKAKIVSLPEGLDLNDFLLSHPAHEFTELINSAQPLTKYDKEGKRKTRKKKKEGKMSADFYDLVDIVEDNGIPTFLIRKGENLILTDEYHVNNELVTPPPISAIPWTLPNGENIINYFNEYQTLDEDTINFQLYNDLIWHFRSVSELYDDSFYSFLPL